MTARDHIERLHAGEAANADVIAALSALEYRLAALEENVRRQAELIGELRDRETAGRSGKIPPSTK